MKQHIGTSGILPAMPVTIIATEVDGKRNFAPHGQCGTVSSNPPVIYTSVVKEHLTARNILATGKFSVNIPHTGLLERIRRGGSVTGAGVDKSTLFDVFYGELGVPMVEDCALCFACKVLEQVEVGDSIVFLGEVMESYAEEDCLTDGRPDIRKIDPLVCSNDGSFWQVGTELV